MAEKHGIEKSAKTKKDKKKKLEDFVKSFTDSSEDEAPDEVTFKESKATALRSLKLAKELAQREREALKEKRRKRLEFFQEQKKKKFCVDDEEKDSSSPPKPAECQNKGEKVKKKKEIKKKKLPHVRKLKGNYQVMFQKETIKDATYQQQEAQDFIQNRLYGPETRRTTNNELLSLQMKKGVVKGAAVTFLKKGWACEDRAKAEQIKKRWIHKQIC